MPKSFTPDLKKNLRQFGCRFSRQGNGDHEIWYSPISGVHFVVDNKIISRHTANGVLKQAGLKKKF
ncbi:MAG TPA: type II toxin-antitoxin system HicA family toxin [Magnetococcales bacterium]|nr:type II toxin-antitoxin system HicA family toxin [Magnetococcales bacterium]